MGKLYSEMTEEEKLGIKRSNAIYKAKHPEMARKSAREYYHRNKEKAAEQAKNWRTNNAEYVREKQRLDKRTRKLWAIDYLGKTCSVCNQSYHPSVYEFHHTDPENKDRDPSKMLSLSLVRLQAELDKCILVCANCHRILHHGNSY